MPTTAEDLKARSAHLRGSIGEELAAPTNSFTSESGQLLKFHGIYQQDDRDARRELRVAKQELAYSCMVRCSVPGGVLTSDQWLDIDRLADDVTDGSLRLTSRQGVQYHFVHKGQLRQLINALHDGLVTTYAACGDVVRNIMVTPAPAKGRDLDRLTGLAESLAERFRPQSSAYWELWIDGKRAVSAEQNGSAGTLERVDGEGKPVPEEQAESEPIYGRTYLPRKFKIGIAWPGDNSIDVYSQDVGIVPVESVDGRPGAVVLAGGGLGRSHKDATTFPRLADPLAWVPQHRIVDVVEAIVTTFRDYGDRTDRAHARLKYVIEDRGISWLRDEVESRIDQALEDPLPLAPWRGGRDHLGWHEQPDGRFYLGLPVPGGRVNDSGGIGRKTAIRDIVATYAGHVRLTPHQDLLLCDIEPGDRRSVETILDQYGVPQAHHLSLTVQSAMACPALPTCGQALGEAERVLPELTDLIDVLLADRGLGDISIETRLTGCPNGCSRPYVAELGIVGRTKTAYDLFVGGDKAGTRLATPLIELVPFQKLGDVLGPLLDRYRGARLIDESFGDWANRTGIAALQEDLPSFASPGRQEKGTQDHDLRSA